MLVLLLLASVAQPALAQSQTVVIDCLPPWETNDRYGHPTRIKHPSLSLNGFDCGSNCDIGYGLKQVLEKVYRPVPDTTVKSVFISMVDLANSALRPGNSRDEVAKNTQIMQARGFVALAAYVLENNDYTPTDLNPALLSAEQAVSRFYTALLDSERWEIDSSLNDDIVKWATPLTNVARAIDFYLALENAYKHYDPAIYYREMIFLPAANTLFLRNVKSRVMSAYSGMIDDLEDLKEVLPESLVNLGENLGIKITRYYIEPGNASLKAQVAIGYAKLTSQGIVRDSETQHKVVSISDGDDYISRAFTAAGGEAINNNRFRYWRYQSDDGKYFWAEGPYYFHLALSQIIPFWHTARINGLLNNTALHPHTFADPFGRDQMRNQSWFLNPLEWLADISTPDGKTPPLDDGHKRSMYNTGILRWSSDYGDNIVGEKFAGVIGAIEAVGGHSLSASLYPVAIAIPRRSVSNSTLPDGIIGNPVNKKTAGGEGRQEVVVRRTIDNKQHYLLLNGESDDATIRGEGHEQADQMQLLYYVDDISYLVDSGYDSPLFTGASWYHSTWNNYLDHNVMTMEPDTDSYYNNDGGIKAPDVSRFRVHIQAIHQNVHEIYYQVHGKIDLLSASIDLRASNGPADDDPTTKMADYYRNVLFIRDATHPYIVDINAVNRIGEFTNWYKMFYHGNSNTTYIPIYGDNYFVGLRWDDLYRSKESLSLVDLDPPGAVNNSFFIQPFTVERNTYLLRESDTIRETRLNEDRGIGLDIKKLRVNGNRFSNGDSQRHFTTVAFMHALDNRESVYFAKENVSLPSESERYWQYFTWSPLDTSTSPPEPDSTIVDVVVARSAAQYVDSATSSSPVKLHFPIAEADSFYMELSGGKNYGFARLRKQGQTWSIDPDFQINLEKSVPHAGLSGPTCIHEGENGHFTAGASGGRPPYTYAWSYYQVCRNRDIPCDRWSTAGSGQAIDFGANNWDRFRLRVQATDNSRPSQSVYSSELDVEVRSSSAGPCPSPSDPPDPQGKAESDINVPEESALEAAGIEEVIPEAYALRQNFPNPFNPSTEILFDLPEDAMVSLVVYDVLGREVARLVQEELRAGTHRARFDAGNLPSGVYFYRMQAGDFHSTHRMTLLK